MRTVPAWPLLTLASESAGQAARLAAPEAEPYARFAGAMGGGFGVAAAHLPRGGNAVITEALRGVDPADLEQARTMMREAAALPGGGIRLTLDEALNRVTGGRTGPLAQTSRVVANAGGEGSRIMGDVYASRPDAVRAVGERAIDALAPAPYPADQAATAGQRAAEGVIGGAQAEINAATRPAYQAAEAQRLGPQVHVALLSDPLYARTLAEVRSNPCLGRTVEHLPDDAVGVVDLVQRRMRETAENARVPGQASSGNLIAANYEDARLAPIAAAETATGGPLGAYATARSEQARLRQERLEPLTNGPVGRVARMDSAAENASARMGRALVGGGEGDRYAVTVGQHVAHMARQDPRAAQTLVRDYVGDTFNKAIGDLKTGPDQYGGAGFRAALAGDPASAANIEAAVRALPHGDARWEGFQRFLDAMEATGYKPTKGSDSYFNALIGDRLKSGQGTVGSIIAGTASGAVAGAGVGGLSGAAGGAALGGRRAVSDALTRFRMAGNGEAVARMLTDPAALPDLRHLARSPVGSRNAELFAGRLAALVKGRGATEPAQSRDGRRR